MSDVTSQLRAIVENPGADEPQPAAPFFKVNPAAAFLLEPDSIKQWGEESVQNYGQIDFVFQLTDGTYRVVEIESPTRQIFTAKNEFTQPAQHAVEQARKWIGSIEIPELCSKAIWSDRF